MEENVKRVYFNHRQIQFAMAPQKTKVWVGGRGSGKSAGIALILRRGIEELPRGKCMFASSTLEQIMNSTLPPVLAKLEELGFRENIHYVIGKPPLSWWEQDKCHPFSPPKEYENTMTFFNGFTVVFISTAKPKGKRGGSYDMAIVDEAAFVKAVTFKKVIVPMVRDNLYRFDSTMHHSIFLLTSQPTDADGKYVLAFEKEHEASPEDVLFLWTSARDNEVVLGEQWFKTMRQNMGYSDYLLEVENERQRKLPKSFYHTFDRDKHFGQKAAINPDELIEVSWDFGGSFNCATLWQERDGYERCLGRFYTKDQQGKVNGVVDAICERLKDHRFRYVRLWGEPRGKDSNPYSDDDLYTIIGKRFNAAGWEYDDKVPQGQQAKKHKERHFFFEAVFTEGNPLLPKVRFNAECEDVVIAIENTPIKNDFQKDKSKEDDPTFPQEHATHFTDTVDNYLVSKHYWRYAMDDANDAPGGYDFI